MSKEDSSKSALPEETGMNKAESKDTSKQEDLESQKNSESKNPVVTDSASEAKVKSAEKKNKKENKSNKKETKNNQTGQKSKGGSKHPDNYRFVIFQDVSNGYRFLTRSCSETKEKIKLEDGNEYPLIKMEISHTSHPFYTGKMKFVDTTGRIDKFRNRYKKFLDNKPDSEK